MKFRTRIYYFLINEVRLLRRAPLPLILSIVMPMAAWIVLTLTFSHGGVEKLPTVVVDYDNSSLSRSITRDLNTTQAINVIEVTGDANRAEELMKQNKSFITVIIDKGLFAKTKTGGSGRVAVVQNGAYMMYAKVGYKIIAQALVNYSHKIQVERIVSKGLSNEDAEVRVSPVSIDIQAMGNPYFDYTIYLIPGMLISILQMSASFSTIWLFREHREHESGRIIPQHGHRLAFILGKITPLVISNTITVVLLFAVIFPLAKIPVNGSYSLIFLNALLLMIVSMGMGAFVSVFMKNLVSAAQFLLVINAPSFVFAGYTYPRWAMPGWVQSISNCIPVTHFLDGFFPDVFV